jgi:Uma2 family endonuclease
MATVEESIPPLAEGQKLTRDEFLRRWEAMPDLKWAELLGGVVYMPSPLSAAHEESDGRIVGVLGYYAMSTPGCSFIPNATWLLLEDVPQPDGALLIRPEFGGTSRIENRYFTGPPELVAETSLSRKTYDLRQKLELYQKAEVPEYLVVLVEKQEVRWHRLVDGAYEVMQPGEDGLLRSQVFPGLWLNPAVLFGGLSGDLLVALNQGLRSPEHAAFVERLTQAKAALSRPGEG